MFQWLMTDLMRCAAKLFPFAVLHAFFLIGQMDCGVAEHHRSSLGPLVAVSMLEAADEKTCNFSFSMVLPDPKSALILAA